MATIKTPPPRIHSTEYEKKPLGDIMIDIIALDKTGFAQKIVNNAKEGDASALKMVQSAFEESLFRQDDKLSISDRQYEEIIRLSYERTFPTTKA